MLGAFKNRGLVYTFAILFNKLVPAALFRFGIMDVYELCNEKLKPLITNENVDFVLVEAPDQREILKSVTRNGLDDASTEPHQAFAIRDRRSEEFIGGLWVACDQFTEASLGFRFQFSESQRWVYCAYIEKEHRQRGHYSACLSFVASELSKSGSVELLVAFNPFNKASAKAHQKFSRTRIGRVYSICIFKKALCFSSGGIKRNKHIGTTTFVVDRSAIKTVGHRFDDP